MRLFLSSSVADRFQVWPVGPEGARIGRSSRNAVQIPDATVSKEHAEIVPQGSSLWIRDLGSRNGTRLNGQEAKEPLELHPGDRLEIGHVVLQVTGDEPSRPVRFNEHTIIDSSLKVSADQLLARRARSADPSASIVHLLAEAGHMLVLPRPLREMCDDIVRLVARAIPGSRQILMLQEREGEDPVPMASHVDGAAPDRPLALSRAIVRTVMEENAAVVTADAAMDPRFMGQQSIVAQSIHSAMAVPLFDNQRVLGILYVDSQDPIHRYSEEQLELLTLLGNMAAVKITNARLLQDEQARMRIAQELASATRIQRGLLPGELPRVEGFELDAHLETCYEVGGDLYDFRVRADGTLWFLIGDVSGKGMGAALLMSSFLASARVLFDVCARPTELARRLGGIMCQTTAPGLFVTGIVGMLDPRTGDAELVNAGHPAALWRHDGALTGLEAGGVPFGLFPDFDYASDTIRLAPRDLIALYSDGIPEAQRGEEFFDDERLRDAIAANGAAALPELRTGVLGQVDAFLAGAPRTDDVTLMLIRRSA